MAKQNEQAQKRSINAVTGKALPRTPETERRIQEISERLIMKNYKAYKAMADK